MGGFALHNILPALRAKVTALHQHDDKLYVGTATGAVQVYNFLAGQGSNGLPKLEWLKTHNLARRQIDQIGVLPHAGHMLVLSVSAYSIADLSAKPRVLSQARNAHSFAITSYDPSKTKGKGKGGVEVTSKGEEVDFLTIGCRKKVVVYPRVDPGFKAAQCWELALPHSPRQVLLPSSPLKTFPDAAHLLYSPTSSVLLRLSPSTPNLAVSDLTSIPPPPPISTEENGSILDAAGVNEKEGGGTGSGLGIGLGGLGGYVGLGGKTLAPVGTSTWNGEVMLAREDVGVFLASDGTYCRSNSLQWSSPPDATVYNNPFIYSAMPAAVSAASSSTAPAAQPSIHVHLGPSLHLRYALPVPHPPTGASSISCLTAISKRADTAASSVEASAAVLFVSSPTDRGLSQAEGCSVWAVQAASLADEVGDLVRSGRMTDAIGLVESVGETGFAPNGRIPHLKTLAAVSDFAFGHYQSAMDQFLLYNINPALVISLYPAETIAGRLHMPRDQWMELFGAEAGSRLQPEVRKLASAEEAVGGKSVLKSVAAAAGLGLVKKGSIDSLRTAVAAGQANKAGSAQVEVVNGQKEEEEIFSEKAAKAPKMDEHEIPRAAMEALMYYLSDRRQKLTGAINQLPAADPLPAEDSLPPLSSLPAADLHQLPNVPFTELSPEQLLRTAQVIYTALLKVYLVARPILVGSLCRIENWCDVEEVEELLKAQKKFTDLIDLYQGKTMHTKALKMLHELAQLEDDRLDRYPPTVRYLQKLGPEYLDTIIESSKWVLQEDPKMGVQIFTADEATVESWPRQRIVDFLDKQDRSSCISYLEHIITELHEEGSEYHEKLADLYIAEAKSAASGDTTAYSNLIKFLSSSMRYRANRLINRIPKDDMPLAQAILLGRMGKHDEALRIYIYRLKDYPAAERHCTRVYADASSAADSTVQPADRSDIFLILLRLYLQPAKSEPVLLEPALKLIGNQGARLDAEKVIALLPPLVTMKDVQDFFVRSLRDGHARRHERRIVTGLASARKEQVDRILMGLQEKRVRITDQRICPQCHKRLGQSAIAVHAPRGEITHLHCKDSFSAHLAGVRG